MQIRHVKHPFGAVIDGECKILILGSVPSVKSVENNFYYMHPKNRFWKVLSALLDCDLYNANVSARKSALLSRHIALYDSVEECDISGSSDSKISNVIPADIPALIGGTKISHIYCNGAASYTYLLKYHPQLGYMTTKLPSTSPANAACTLEALTDAWKIILNSIDEF
ncbi:MAG: DNA-deoxyinosine glycosylase [Bacteroides sp.]|nr:DNA-deoxyinosine glycosylase [Bacillota bacterium]MCM1393471.1 DNA-deoxyinosine glycosylase [[Eubacterium] siraeum]MCM1455295.1 DNA-deoxyinosine glycosylase [Bacteroides sp.]